MKQFIDVQLRAQVFLFGSGRTFSPAVALGEVVEELASLADEDVEIDGEELTGDEALESVGDQRFVDEQLFGKGSLQGQTVAAEAVLADADRVGGVVVVPCNKQRARAAVDLGTQVGEISGFLQPVVKQKRLIGEGLSAASTPVSLDPAEGAGRMKAIAIIPVLIVKIEAVGAAAGIRTEKVCIVHTSCDSDNSCSDSLSIIFEVLLKG